MGSNCARTIDVTHDIERRPTTTETRVAHDNSTWHAMNTTYINSTKETYTHTRARMHIHTHTCTHARTHTARLIKSIESKGEHRSELVHPEY